MVLPDQPAAIATRTALATLASGGFNVDVLAGVEFMRASRVQFYLEAALLPVDVVENGDGPANVSTWFPGASFTLGMLF